MWWQIFVNWIFTIWDLERKHFRRTVSSFENRVFILLEILISLHNFRTLVMNFTWWRTRSFCARQITTVPKQKVPQPLFIWNNLFFQKKIAKTKSTKVWYFTKSAMVVKKPSLKRINSDEYFLEIWNYMQLRIMERVMGISDPGQRSRPGKWRSIVNK